MLPTKRLLPLNRQFEHPYEIERYPRWYTKSTQMTENTPPMIPTEFLPFLEDPRPLLTVVVRKRRVWVAQKEQGSEWLVHVMTSLMIPVLSFSAIVSVLYTFWSRSSLSTKRKIHYEVHKTSVLLTKVMKRPEIYNNRKATVNAVVFWASMTFLLGVYCVGIALGYDTKVSRRARRGHRVNRRW